MYVCMYVCMYAIVCMHVRVCTCVCIMTVCVDVCIVQWLRLGVVFMVSSPASYYLLALAHSGQQYNLHVALCVCMCVCDLS